MLKVMSAFNMYSMVAPKREVKRRENWQRAAGATVAVWSLLLIPISRTLFVVVAVFAAWLLAAKWRAEHQRVLIPVKHMSARMVRVGQTHSSRMVGAAAGRIGGSPRVRAVVKHRTEAQTKVTARRVLIAGVKHPIALCRADSAVLGRVVAERAGKPGALATTRVLAQRFTHRAVLTPEIQVLDLLKDVFARCAESYAPRFPAKMQISVHHPQVIPGGYTAHITTTPTLRTASSPGLVAPPIEDVTDWSQEIRAALPSKHTAHGFTMIRIGVHTAILTAQAKDPLRVLYNDGLLHPLLSIRPGEIPDVGRLLAPIGIGVTHSGSTVTITPEPGEHLWLYGAPRQGKSSLLMILIIILRLRGASVSILDMEGTPKANDYRHIRGALDMHLNVVGPDNGRSAAFIQRWMQLVAAADNVTDRGGANTRDHLFVLVIDGSKQLDGDGWAANREAQVRFGKTGAWVINALQLANKSDIPPAGRSLDRIGHTKILVGRTSKTLVQMTLESGATDIEMAHMNGRGRALVQTGPDREPVLLFGPGNVSTGDGPIFRWHRWLSENRVGLQIEVPDPTTPKELPAATVAEEVAYPGLSDVQIRIVGIVAANPGITQPAVRNRLDVKERTFYRNVQMLVASGVMVRTAVPNRASILTMATSLSPPIDVDSREISDAVLGWSSTTGETDEATDVA